jgi:hypothetical protein
MGEVYVWSDMDAGNWEDVGGRESSILKQDERKKLFRDMPPPTFRPPLSSWLWLKIEVHGSEDPFRAFFEIQVES